VLKIPAFGNTQTVRRNFKPMTLQELTLNILAERALTQFDSKKLVDWSVQVLELGFENKNLYILAGLDFDSTEEREKYFWESLKDLRACLGI
jgi:hypothetical protein